MDITLPLMRDDRYAKAIVSLAGVRTAEIKGLDVDVSAAWNGIDYKEGVWIAAGTPEQGVAVWREAKTPRLFKLTLGALEETFRELTLAPSFVTMVVTISTQKRPHFRKFVFNPASGYMVDTQEVVIRLPSIYWKPSELELIAKELRKMPRKLKGMGLI